MYNCYSGVHLRLLFSALDINDWILIHPWQDTGVKEFYLRERTREREREREKERERESALRTKNKCLNFSKCNAKEESSVDLMWMGNCK